MTEDGEKGLLAGVRHPEQVDMRGRECYQRAPLDQCDGCLMLESEIQRLEDV